MTYRVNFIAHLIQGEFTEYHIKVTSSEGDSWLIRRRYREFRELHDHLKLKYPDSLPSVSLNPLLSLYIQIPGKRLWGNQDPDFVKERQDGLQRYMDSLLDIEPECSTKFFRLFLEIRDAPKQPRQSDRPSGPSAPSIAEAPAPPSDDRKRIFQEVQEALFDLSAAPTLLEPAEVQQRHQRYLEIFNRCVASSEGTLAPYVAPAPVLPAVASPKPQPQGVIVNLS